MKSIKQIHFIIPIAVIVSIIMFQQCRMNKLDNKNAVTIFTNQEGKGLQFVLTFERGKTHNYPLMAVWLETPEGEYIQTLFVAQSVGKGVFQNAQFSSKQWMPGPLRRPATLPYWAHKYNSKVHNPEVYPNPKYPVPDSYTGATPKGDFMLNSKSDEILNKPFRILFEINQFFDFNEYWHNAKYADDKDYKTSGQPALVYASEIISPDVLPANYTFTLIGHSHYSGKTGELLQTLNTITTAKNIVNNISVQVAPKN